MHWALVFLYQTVVAFLQDTVTVDRERRKSNVHQQKLMWKEHRSHLKDLGERAGGVSFEAVGCLGEILMTDLYSPDMFDLPRNPRTRRGRRNESLRHLG